MIYIIIALTAILAMLLVIIAEQNKMIDYLVYEMEKQAQPLEPISFPYDVNYAEHKEETHGETERCEIISSTTQNS